MFSIKVPYLFVFSVRECPKHLLSDRLGLGTVVTDKRGEPVHVLSYMPYGEDWVDIRHNGYFGSAYKFNGKEKDRTGTNILHFNKY